MKIELSIDELEIMKLALQMDYIGDDIRDPEKLALLKKIDSIIQAMY